MYIVWSRETFWGGTGGRSAVNAAMDIKQPTRSSSSRHTFFVSDRRNQYRAGDGWAHPSRIGDAYLRSKISWVST
jgi:hypothetical protein